MASIQDLHITAAILANGAVKILYAGLDAAKAQEFYSRAGTDVLEVGVISHPQAVFPRRPNEEARLAKESAEAAEARAQRERDKLAILAEAKEAQAKALASDAKAMRDALAAQLRKSDVASGGT